MRGRAAGWRRLNVRDGRHLRQDGRGISPAASGTNGWGGVGAPVTFGCSSALVRGERAVVRTCCPQLSAPVATTCQTAPSQIHTALSSPSRGSRGGYPLAALGSEDWCNPSHGGVFSDGRPSVHGVAPSPTGIQAEPQFFFCGGAPGGDTPRPLVNPPARVARGAGPDADQEDLLCAPRVAPVLLRNVHE